MEVLVSQEDKTEIENKQIYTSGKYPFLRVDGRRVSLHKFIAERMGLITRQGEVIDHINGNKFDARRDNLRVLNYSQNSQNRIMETKPASGFRGVYKCICGPRWQVYCGTTRIGYFTTPEDGANAYDKYVIKFVHRDGQTNFEHSETDKDEILKSDFEVQTAKKFDPEMKGIYWKEASQAYEVQVNGKNVVGRMFKELDEAQKARDDGYAKYNEEKERKRLEVPVRVNASGQAIIPLTGKRGVGKFCITDYDTWHELAKSSWNLANTGYPQARINNKLWNLHEYLMRDVEREKYVMVIDHINTNKLDNRVSNLRVVSRSENAKNLSEETRKKLSEIGKGSVKPRRNRKNPEDNNLPKYVSSIRTAKYQGYTVQKHPTMKGRTFLNAELSMDEKLALALAYLSTASS